MPPFETPEAVEPMISVPAVIDCNSVAGTVRPELPPAIFIGVALELGTKVTVLLPAFIIGAAPVKASPSAVMLILLFVAEIKLPLLVSVLPVPFRSTVTVPFACRLLPKLTLPVLVNEIVPLTALLTKLLRLPTFVMAMLLAASPDAVTFRLLVNVLAVTLPPVALRVILLALMLPDPAMFPPVKICSALLFAVRSRSPLILTSPVCAAVPSMTVPAVMFCSEEAESCRPPLPPAILTAFVSVFGLIDTVPVPALMLPTTN